MKRITLTLVFVALVALAISACGSRQALTSATTTPTATDTPTPTSRPATAIPVASATPTRTPRPTNTVEPTATSVAASGGGVSSAVSGGSSATGGGSSAANIPASIDIYVPPACPEGTQYDPVRATCVDPDLIDCGPSPYNYNAVSGNWERLFYEVCWHTNHDAFEKMFHALNYTQVQELLAEYGLDGLTHDQQVDALLNAGYLGGPGGLEPIITCSDGYEFNTSTGKCEPDLPPDCGPNPYVFNEVKGEWERDFNKWCFGINRDPFEILFHKMDYTRVGQHLESVGLAGLTHDEQVAGLANLGYWNLDGAYVPDGAPTFPR